MTRVAASENQNSSIYENYFESNFPPLPLPMIWRVVYHEAIRGNHILWDRADLDSIENLHQSAELKMSSEDRNAITSFMVKFMGGSDYRQLQAMIQTLSMNQKAVAFILYRRAISVWQRWLKTNLN